MPKLPIDSSYVPPPGLQMLDDQETKRAALKAAIHKEADKLRAELPVGFQTGNLRDVAAAADRLARKVFNFSHGEDCLGDLDGEDQECSQCGGDEEGPCSCDCGMCAVWRDALIIRPQGVRDPQPARIEAPDA